MASPEQIQLEKELAEKTRKLKADYRALIKNSALCDLVNHLTTWRNDARKIGDSETDNTTRKVLHTHAAGTYEKVLAYVEKMQAEEQ